MALSDLKITNSDTHNKKISDIEGDTLIGTPADNKAKFDAYCELIKTRFNDLVDAINDGFVLSGGEYVINPSAIQDASSSNKGLMSAEDKAKLDQMLVQVGQVADGVLAPPTSDAVFDAIQRISGVAPNINDYVVSYEKDIIGTDDRTYWDRRKWASGICEVWLSPVHQNHIESAPTSWDESNVNGLYYYIHPHFPLYYPRNSFVSAPQEFVNIVGQASVSMWLATRGGTSQANRKARTQTYSIYRVSEPSSSVTIYYDCYAIGRWK